MSDCILNFDNIMIFLKVLKIEGLFRMYDLKILIPKESGCTGWSVPLLFARNKVSFFLASWSMCQLYSGIPYLSRDMRFPTMRYVRTAKPQISLAYAQSDQSLC